MSEVVSKLAALVQDSTRSLVAAEKVKAAADVNLPQLKIWNYDPCRKHRAGWTDPLNGIISVQIGKPKPGCRFCGLVPRAHQRVGSLWMLLRRRGLLADVCGSGKTAQAGLLIALTAELGEFSQGRVLIVCRASAVRQWATELSRMMPKLIVLATSEPQAERAVKYRGLWHVCVIGPELLQRDFELLERVKFQLVISDDVDSLRNTDTRTHYVVNWLGNKAQRFIIMSASPLQKRLLEMHALLTSVGGKEVFGTVTSFERRYLRQERTKIYNPRTGRSLTSTRVTGYDNLDEFKALISPMVLRRKSADLTDVTLPEIVPHDVELELYPEQRAKYEELREGVLRIRTELGEKIKHNAAKAKVTYGQQICAGLSVIGERDRPQSSVKFDWVMDKITGDLSDEKVVVFAINKQSIATLSARLTATGVGHGVIWGNDANKDRRQATQNRFWDDPNCQVLLGTGAIEQSLNLQVARHLINVDRILNPERMVQLAGRIRRDGSQFKHVFVHNLIAQGTQEVRYTTLLEREAALTGHIWDETSDLFAPLSPLALLNLIGSPGDR